MAEALGDRVHADAAINNSVPWLARRSWNLIPGKPSLRVRRANIWVTDEGQRRAERSVPSRAGNAKAPSGNRISEVSTSTPSGIPATRRKWRSRSDCSRATSPSSILMVRRPRADFGPFTRSPYLSVRSTDLVTEIVRAARSISHHLNASISLRLMPVNAATATIP
jgi:hypothetical protein